MRLAVFTNQFPARVNTFFARDMRALLKQGIEIDIFPLHPLDPALWRCVPSVLDEGALPRERIHHVHVRASLQLPHARCFRRLPLFVRDVAGIEAAALRYGIRPLAKSAYAALKAWAWAREYGGQFDHILAYWGNYSATCAYLFHRLSETRIPFSMFVHARMDLYQTPVYLARKLLYADNIFLVCDFNQRYLRDKYPGIFPRLAEKIHIHHLGLDLDEVRFEPEPGARPPRKVLAVGRWEKLKGFDKLLRAVEVLRRRGLVLEVELVGYGEQERELRRLAAELGIERQVLLRGWIPPDEVSAAMRQATILAHPPIGLDGMPTVIKEALAVGTPVVASNVAGIPEMLDGGRCGVLVPPGDVEALALGIQNLITDEALRRRYACRGREHVERHFDLWVNGRTLATRLRATKRHREG